MRHIMSLLCTYFCANLCLEPQTKYIYASIICIEAIVGCTSGWKPHLLFTQKTFLDWLIFLGRISSYHTGVCFFEGYYSLHTKWMRNLCRHSIEVRRTLFQAVLCCYKVLGLSQSETLPALYIIYEVTHTFNSFTALIWGFTCFCASDESTNAKNVWALSRNKQRNQDHSSIFCSKVSKVGHRCEKKFYITMYVAQSNFLMFIFKFFSCLFVHWPVAA